MKKACPEMVIITDLCACEYTSHGHCGHVGECLDGPGLLNDESLEMMQEIAVSQAEAGADIVAPSCMLDGMVCAIRRHLIKTGTMKSLSCLTPPSLPLLFMVRFVRQQTRFFVRRQDQARHCSNRLSFSESEFDAAEGADILMVKPAGWFGDIITDIKQIGLPVAAYKVSGEYSMINAAAEKGWLDERQVVMESLLSLKRAGADLLITYFAEDVCRWLDE